MLEIARQLQADKKLNPNIGVDFVCFDTEDWGTPRYIENMQDKTCFEYREIWNISFAYNLKSSSSSGSG